MGYGARALESLNSFYSGDLLNLDEVMEEDSVETFAEAASKIDKVSSKRISLFIRRGTDINFTTAGDYTAKRQRRRPRCQQDAASSATSFGKATGTARLPWSFVRSDERPVAILETGRICTIIRATNRQRPYGRAHVCHVEDAEWRGSGDLELAGRFRSR